MHAVPVIATTLECLTRYGPMGPTCWRYGLYSLVDALDDKRTKASARCSVQGGDGRHGEHMQTQWSFPRPLLRIHTLVFRRAVRLPLSN